MNEAAAIKFLVEGVNEDERIMINGVEYEKVRVEFGFFEECQDEKCFFMTMTIFTIPMPEIGFHETRNKVKEKMKEVYGDLFNENEMFYYNKIEKGSIYWSEYI